MSQDLSTFIQDMQKATSLEESLKILNQVGVVLKLWKVNTYLGNTVPYWFEIAPTLQGTPGDQISQRNALLGQMANSQEGFDFLLKNWKTSFCGCILDNNAFMALYFTEGSEEFMNKIADAYGKYSYYSTESYKLLLKIRRERMVKVLPKWWKLLACDPSSPHREMPKTSSRAALEKWFDYEFSLDSDYESILESLHIFLMGKDAVYGVPVAKPWASLCFQFLMEVHGMVWGRYRAKIDPSTIANRIQRYTLLTTLVATELGVNPPDHPFRTLLQDA